MHPMLVSNVMLAGPSHGAVVFDQINHFYFFFFVVLLSCLKELLLHFYSDCCYVDREGSSK